jgi:hypothetical protein
VAVRVVAYDIWGKYASYEQSPAILYTVVGNVTSISVPPVTGADFLWAGRDCKLFWNYNSNTASFEFGSEPDGATGARDPQFMDYEIRVYDTNAKRKLLRTEHTTDNGYIYTYEKNLADGLHRRLTFEIAVRDIFGHMGKPAVIEAYNPPPFVTTAGQTAAFDRATIQYTHSDDPDFQGAMFYLSDISPVKLVPENIAYDGPDSAVLLTNLMFNHDYYCVIAPYDAFGRDELIPSAEIHFKTPFLDVAAIADGVLKDSQLVPGLQQRIDLVDAPAKVIGSVNERLEKAKTEITQEIDSHSDEIEAVSKKVDVVSAKTDGNAALISVEQEARATAEEAIGKRIDTVASTVAGNTAAIQTEATTRSDADSALSTRVDVVAAATSQNSADITTEQTARADGDGALSSWITTLQSTVGGNTAAIQQTASTVNGISAQYTVKIDNNGYVAGYGLASYPVNGGIVSEFAVRADTFSVQLPGYAGIRPFTIGAVYGVPRVIISNALIGDASIDNAKIGDLQVNTAKISDGAITYAKIGYAQIGTAHIGEAQIDTLRIGPNAVSTLASWSGTNMTPVYTASGGQCLIVFDGGSGASAFNQIRLLIDGGVARLVYVGNNGASNTVSFATTVWQGYLPPGNHSLRCEVANGTNWTGNIPTTIAVFEAKR